MQLRGAGATPAQAVLSTALIRRRRLWGGIRVVQGVNRSQLLLHHRLVIDLNVINIHQDRREARRGELLVALEEQLVIPCPSTWNATAPWYS